MLSCKDITEKANEYLDQELPFFTRLKMTMHLKICKQCDRYVKQLHTTIQALGKMKKQETVDDATVDQVLDNLREFSQTPKKSE